MYEVRLSKVAEEFYRRADKPLARKLARCFEQLEREPRNHPNVKPLKGELAGVYRFRVGDHRVLYRIDDPVQIVSIAKIAHRRDVYD